MRRRRVAGSYVRMAGSRCVSALKNTVWSLIVLVSTGTLNSTQIGVSYGTPKLRGTGNSDAIWSGIAGGGVGGPTIGAPDFLSNAGTSAITVSAATPSS